MTGEDRGDDDTVVRVGRGGRGTALGRRAVLEAHDAAGEIAARERDEPRRTHEPASGDGVQYSTR